METVTDKPAPQAQCDAVSQACRRVPVAVRIADALARVATCLAARHGETILSRGNLDLLLRRVEANEARARRSTWSDAFIGEIERRAEAGEFERGLVGGGS